MFENRRRLLRCSNPQSLAGPAELEQGLASITEKGRKVAALGKGGVYPKHTSSNAPRNSPGPRWGDEA